MSVSSVSGASATVSGAISGIDTASLIDSLVSASGAQQTMLKNRQSTAQKAVDAYASIITSMNTLASQAKTLAKTSAWTGATATSSSTSVTAKATGTDTASLTFDVVSVAAAHSLISASSVGSTTDSVASSGSVTLTKGDGTTTSIDVGNGSLTEVVRAINSAGAGLKAAAVQTSAGQYRLQVTASSTGSASSFTLSGVDGFAGLNVLAQGADAEISVGSDPATAYTVTSSSNTFGSVVAGLSFTVSKVESGVTVSSELDASTVAGQVKTLVSTANSVLSQLSSYTSWNASTRTGGALVGESTIRALRQSILSTVGSAAAPGVELTRDGTITFDEAKFSQAFTADPQKVAKAFGASISFTPASGVSGSTSLVRVGDRTVPGTYDITVTANAQREQWALTDLNGPPWSGHRISVTAGATVVEYTPSDDDTLSDVVAQLNTRVRAAGLGIGVASNGTTVVFTSDRAGSTHAFTASLDGAEGSRLTAGADIQGTIDEQAATGIGNVLALGSGTGGAVGLAIEVDVSDSDIQTSGGAIGSVTYSPGLAQAFVRLATRATASGDGLLVSAQASRQKAVEDIQDQIDAWTTRLDSYRHSLTLQFTAMETALASLKSQTTALAGLKTFSDDG